MRDSYVANGVGRLRMLLACQPIPGHLNPNLALAQVLRQHGHEVAIYSGAGARKIVEEQGHVLYQFQPLLDRALSSILMPRSGEGGASTVPTDRRGYWRVGRLNGALREFLIDPIPAQVEDLRGIAIAFQPDVLVSDVTLLGPILILKDTMRVPVAVFSPLAACSVPGPDAPPWGRGLPPPRTWSTRARASIERRLIDWLTSDLRAAANQLRDRYGLPPLAGRIADEYGAVPLFLVCTTPSFDYARQDLPPSVRYVGACTWQGGSQSTTEPAWFRDLDASRPIVHVTEGTIHTRAPRVLRAAAGGLSGRPMHVVMTTGKHRKPEDLDLGVVGPNVRVEQFVPHHLLLPRTNVVVTTGGAGTINAALLAGVPLVVVPTAWDLPENAQRVVEAGVGLRLDPHRCTPGRLRAAVETVLADASYRENARQMGTALKGEGGAERAARLLEQLAPMAGALDAPA